MLVSSRTGTAACAAVLACIGLAPDLAAEGSPATLTLQGALDTAFAESPTLKARRLEVELAESRLVTAGTVAFNPEVSLAAARRTGGGDSTTDRGVSLTQELEIGGQLRRRVTVADAELAAARGRLLREEQRLAAGVRVAFVEALRARALLEVERANTALAVSLSEAARKRFDSGAIAQMEVNLAQVQVGRAQRDLRLAEGADRVGRAALAEAVGLDPAVPPDIEGTLDVAAHRPTTLEALLATAGDRRADLQALRDGAQAARARIELARRQAIPNIKVGAHYGREDGTDRLLGAEITLGIPIFDRNRGAIAEARADERRTRAETHAAELRVRQEVAASLARYDANQAASQSMKRQVLGTLEENLELLERSFQAGKTDWTEVLVFRREFVDAQRDYVETLTAARLAGIELDLASGLASPGTEPNR